MILTFTLIKLNPHSPATAFARSVLPVPGSPYKSTPLSLRSGHVSKTSPYCQHKYSDNY